MQGSVVFLNGPPRSGKDTAADALVTSFNAFHYKMSQPLKLAVPALIGMKHEELEKRKDEPTWFGPTYREMQIAMSEVYAKPLLGKDVFGRIAVTHLKNHMAPGRVMVISDCGFVEEMIPIIEWINHRNCLIIQLHREGCDFNNDSRSYVDYNGVTVQELYNKHDLEGFKAQIVRAVERWHDERKMPR